MRLRAPAAVREQNAARRGNTASGSPMGRYRTGVTERTGMPGDPEDDPYRHLFRDEPPQPPADAGPSAPAAQPPTMLPDPDDFFADDDDDVAVEPPRAGDEVEVVPGADYFHAPPAEQPSNEPGHDQPSDDQPGTEVAYEADAAYGDGTFAVEDAPEPNPASASVEPAREVETGRLFRSTDADPATGAIPALRSDERRRLRTVGARGKAAAAGAPIVADGAADRSTDHRAPAGTRSATPDEGGRRRGKHTGNKRASAPAVVPSGPGLRAIGVFVVVIAVTLLLGLVDVMLGGGLGPIFGVGLLLSSAYGAFAVRSDDAIYAVTAPPIAAFLAVITVGQLNAGASATTFVSRVINAFFALADNWMWVIGSTLVALVIVVVRSMRAKRA